MQQGMKRPYGRKPVTHNVMFVYLLCEFVQLLGLSQTYLNVGGQRKGK